MGVVRAVEISEFGAADVLRTVERPEPVPVDGELSIDVAYAGVGLVDMLMRRGDFPLSLPLIPGIEATGHVRALGPGPGRAGAPRRTPRRRGRGASCARGPDRPYQERAGGAGPLRARSAEGEPFLHSQGASAKHDAGTLLMRVTTH